MVVWSEASPATDRRSANRRRPGIAARLCRILTEFLPVETGFVLFLFSGWYKGLPGMQWFPVDFTLFFFIITFFLIMATLLSGRIKALLPSPSIPLMILFSGFALASLCWSSQATVNIDKAWRFLFLTSPSFFIGYIIAQDRKRLRRFTRMLLWFSCAFLLYYFYLHYWLGIAMHTGTDMGPDNYLEYGFDTDYFFIICLSLAAFGSPMQLYPAALGAGAALYALLIMGGRETLAAAPFAVVVLALALLRRRGRPLRRLALFVGLIALAAVGYASFAANGSGIDPDSFTTLQRFQAQLSGEDTESMDERSAGRALAFRMWLEAPILGLGMGEFVVRDPPLRFPHNLPLEILAEMGVIGALLFFAVVAIAVRDCVRIAEDQTCDWSTAAIALLFLSVLVLDLTVQGYLADERAFFAYMGLVIGSRLRRPLPPSRCRFPRVARKSVSNRAPLKPALMPRQTP